MMKKQLSPKAIINKSPPQPTFSLSQRGILQRTCDCGEIAGLTGECEACRRQRLIGQRGTDSLNSSSQGEGGYHFGNLAIAPLIQPKLTVSQPGGQYEQEADRVAEQVMRMPEPKIQRVCPECEEELQRQPQKEEDEEERLQTKPLAEQITPFLQRQTEPMEEDEEERLQAKPLAEQITPFLQRQIEPMEEEEEEKRLQAKTTSGQTPTVSSSLHNQITALQGGGQPLSESERTFFEPRFGHDFSQVRVHTDSQASETASGVNARAFTLGQDIVFGKGQYQPSGFEGKSLLAHELTHVVQQSDSNYELIHKLQQQPTDVIQRAEIDDDPSHCQNLVDIEADINNYVNGILQRHRGVQDGRQRVQSVYEDLGRGSPYSVIEQWLENLPPNKRRRVPISQSHYDYAGLPGRRRGSGFINAWWRGEGAMGVVVQVAGRCVGSDKFGHFFQQGRDYYHITQLMPSGHQGLPARDYARAFGEWLEGAPPRDQRLARWIRAMSIFRWPGFDRLAYGMTFWQGVFGLSTTGVYSAADLVANEAGMHFYQAVDRNPNLVFNVRNYLTGLWSETANPSCYNSYMARIVAANDPRFQAERARILQQVRNEPAPSPPRELEEHGLADAQASESMRMARAMRLVFEALQRYARPLECNF